ncbi:MAG: lytic transglycosylase domain-containing protein [Proteobacteria bacterium]|nr:lytic transglycosylase domain-containing protein [Pseudomonadota bacterium]
MIRRSGSRFAPTCSSPVTTKPCGRCTGPVRRNAKSRTDAVQRPVVRTREIVRHNTIPLFAEGPSHPSVPLDGPSAVARSIGQGWSQTGACALPLTDASTVARSRHRGIGSPVRIALLLFSGLFAVAMPPVAALAQSVTMERPSRADPYIDDIAQASLRFGIPAAWIRAVMRVESAGNPSAISRAGAVGLMEIMPDTWAGLRVRHRLGNDPSNPHDSILAGAAYLREMHDRYGSPGFLAAYNAGPGRYEEYLAGRSALPAETRAYVSALAPLVGAGEIDSTISIAAADPQSWTRAPLFVARLVSTTAAENARSRGRVDDAPVAPITRDVSAIVPQSDGLFVARSGDGGPR